MYYKWNLKYNGMLALIRFSDTFYLVVPKIYFLFRLQAHRDISPPFISPLKTPYEVI